MNRNTKLVLSIVLVVLIFAIEPLLGFISSNTGVDLSAVAGQKRNLIVIGLAWLTIVLLRRLKTNVLRRYDLNQEDNLHSRKVHTQINILEKVLIFIIIATAIGLVLLSFESIREIGIGLFASAGIAGIILGLSAQKVVGALLAGIQIAITQPFRLDDAVLAVFDSLSAAPMPGSFQTPEPLTRPLGAIEGYVRWNENGVLELLAYPEPDAPEGW